MEEYKDTISGETLWVWHTDTGVFYYKDNTKSKFHRVDGPAQIYHNGDKLWRRNHKIHRLDGPAIEWGDGAKEWCIDGRDIAYKSAKGVYNRSSAFK